MSQKTYETQGEYVTEEETKDALEMLGKGYEKIKKECIGCREIRDIQERNLCSNCVAWEKQHLIDLQEEVKKENTCEKCGYVGVATDLHHVHGRKNSDVTVRLCCNCHAEIHRGAR